jgi:hypothetical protein
MRKVKAVPPKLKSWRRHWPQWPKARKKRRLFAIRYRNPPLCRTVRDSVHTAGRSFELSYRTGAALVRESKGPDPQPRLGRPTRFVQIRRLRWGYGLTEEGERKTILDPSPENLAPPLLPCEQSIRPTHCTHGR